MPMKPGLHKSALIAALILQAPGHSLSQTTSPELVGRPAVLRDIASQVLAPEWQDVATRCRELTNAVQQFVAVPGQSTLEDARHAWLAAAQSANRVRCFQSGPLTDRGCASTFYYWQVLPARIEGVLKSPRPIDQALVDELGATSKGLFAVEYLLFDDKGGNPGQPAKQPPALQLMIAPDSQRRRSFLLAVAVDLEVKARQVANDWSQHGDRGETAKFVSGGQESLNLLVNQLAASMEDVAEKRLHFVLLLRPPISEEFYRIERSRSGSSLEGVLASLDGIQKTFRGANSLGLDDALKRLNPPLVTRLHEQFERTIATARAIGAPLEQAVVDRRPALEKACEETRALEILLKVDVASALGVTLTFSSNDGD